MVYSSLWLVTLAQSTVDHVVRTYTKNLPCQLCPKYSLLEQVENENRGARLAHSSE